MNRYLLSLALAVGLGLATPSTAHADPWLTAPETLEAHRVMYQGLRGPADVRALDVRAGHAPAACSA